jgi:segregation and condensation protein A
MLLGVTTVALCRFEGPLDVLLTLWERGELDLTAVALAEVVRRFLAELRATAADDPAPLAEFVAAAARLVEAKSLALLPRPPGPVVEPSPPPPAELEALLAEYRRFKAAALAFQAREQEGLRSFPRIAPPPVPPSPGLSGVTLDRLVALVQEALRRRPPDPPGPLPAATVTVRAQLAVLEGLLARAGSVRFADFIALCRTRIEVIVGFMAVLELIRRGRATAAQPEPFGDILIVAAVPLAPAAD